jgi:DNA polymerase
MTAATYLPQRRTRRAMVDAARECRGCELYRHATQTVFGEGPRSARLLLVGEQPGNDEDLEGRPFVGPAGRLLDQALEAAGLDRRDVYVTNAVKHFKWEPSGKRRLHKKPSAREVSACKPWLEAELDWLSPQGVICLGATAAQALLGREFRMMRSRGELIPGEERWIMATWHPSAVLRAPEKAQRDRMREELIADLTTAAEALRP